MPILFHAFKAPVESPVSHKLKAPCSAGDKAHCSVLSWACFVATESPLLKLFCFKQRPSSVSHKSASWKLSCSVQSPNFVSHKAAVLFHTKITSHCLLISHKNYFPLTLLISHKTPVPFDTKPFVLTSSSCRVWHQAPCCISPSDCCVSVQVPVVFHTKPLFCLTVRHQALVVLYTELLLCLIQAPVVFDTKPVLYFTQSPCPVWHQAPCISHKAPVLFDTKPLFCPVLFDTKPLFWLTPAWPSPYSVIALFDTKPLLSCHLDTKPLFTCPGWHQAPVVLSWLTPSPCCPVT